MDWPEAAHRGLGRAEIEALLGSRIRRGSGARTRLDHHEERALRVFPWVICGLATAENAVVGRDLAFRPESRKHNTWNNRKRVPSVATSDRLHAPTHRGTQTAIASQAAEMAQERPGHVEHQHGGALGPGSSGARRPSVRIRRPSCPSRSFLRVGRFTPRNWYLRHHLRRSRCRAACRCWVRRPNARCDQEGRRDGSQASG